jgi:hypothetical protein
MSEDLRRWGGPAIPLRNFAELADHYALARSAFAQDAVTHGKQGVEAIDESLPKTYGVAASFHATQHIISNQYIHLDGDDAIVWSYGVAHHKVAQGEKRDEIIAGVQYRDTCKRFAEGWLITERSIFPHWIDIAAPPAPVTNPD